MQSYVVVFGNGTKNTVFKAEFLIGDEGYQCNMKGPLPVRCGNVRYLVITKNLSESIT